MVTTGETSDLDVFSGSYTIQPLSIVYSYPPPEITEADALLDPNYWCQCNGVTYKYAIIQATSNINRSTDAWWIDSRTAFIWHAQRVKAVRPIRESFLDGPTFLYVGVGDHRVCRVGGRTGSSSVTPTIPGMNRAFRKELRSHNGHTIMLEYVTYPSFYQLGYGALHTTPRPKAFPDETYNDTVAMAEGRESSCLSYALV